MISRFASTTMYFIEAYHVQSNTGSSSRLKNYTSTTFPHNMWIKVELFVDYNAQIAYWYIPTLNLFKADALTSSTVYLPDNIYFAADWLKPTTSVVKFDNITLTALQSVPTYILSANEWVSSTFNIYPNPATNVVNITNSENMLVEQVTV